MYEYRAQVLDVKDGDTIVVDADLGDYIRRQWDLRLAGINCPEKRTPAGKAAAEFVTTWIARRLGRVMVRTIKDNREKYGRMLCRLWDDDTGECLNQTLLEAGHAVAYDGKGKAA